MGPSSSAAARSGCSGSPPGPVTAGGAVARPARRRRRGAGATPGPPARVRRDVRPPATREHLRSGRRHGRGAGTRPPAQLRADFSAHSPGLACVVVDDASADAGATRRSPTTRRAVVALTANSAPSAARNAGLALVDTALVAFVDSDCVPRDGWLEPLLGPLRRPAGRGGGTADRRRPARTERVGPLRSRALVARPGTSARPGSAGCPDPLSSRAPRSSCAPTSRGPRPLRPGPARRRGRRPRVAPDRGRMGCPLRARERRHP